MLQTTLDLIITLITEENIFEIQEKLPRLIGQNVNYDGFMVGSYIYLVNYI